jgi:hypothetical protein
MLMVDASHCLDVFQKESVSIGPASLCRIDRRPLGED